MAALASNFSRPCLLMALHGCSEPTYLHGEELAASSTARATGSNQKVESARKGEVGRTWTRTHVGRTTVIPTTRAWS